MKRLLYFAVLVIFITACKKNIREDLQKNDEPIVSIDNDLSPVPAYDWYQLPKPVLPANTSQAADGLNVIIPVNGLVYCIRGFYHSRDLYKLNNTTKTWAPSNDFVIDAESQYLFSYGTKIYFGFLLTSQGIFNSFYSIDVTTGVKTNMATFPGTPVSGPRTFVLNGKGYIMGGINSNENLVNQFWEYNFATNQWINKGSNPLGNRSGSYVVVIDDKVYMGLGYTTTSINGQQIKLYKNDWIQYDVASGFGIIKADFPGTKRSGTRGFVINSSAYLGLGLNANLNDLNDFWKYNPSNNSWTQQANWPGNFEVYKNDFGMYSQGNTGYLVKGELAEFWKFSNSPFVIQ